jgi:hypothetical protein
VILRLLLVFLLSRAVAVGATHLGARFMTPEKRAQWEWIPGRDNLFPGPPPSPFLAPLVRWDANFYVSLTRDGYPPRHGGPNHHLVFFPLYPMLLRALPMDVFRAAFLVSNLCCLIAALCILRLAGFEAAALFLCGPGSHFFSYPYSEALFAAALAAMLLLMQSRRFLAAGLAGAVATATRSPGVAAAVALFTQRSTKAFLAGLLSLGGIAAYMWWCHVAQGDALAFMHLQAYHGRQLSLLGPVKAFLAFDTDPDYYLVTIAAIYVAVKLVGRTPAWQWVTAVFLVLLPLGTGTLAAMIRYQSANVPLICGVPKVLQGRPFWIATGLCLALMALEAFLYGKGIGHF